MTIDFYYNGDLNKDIAFYECKDCGYRIRWQYYCHLCKKYKDHSDATENVCGKSCEKIKGEQSHWMSYECYGNNTYGQLVASDTWKEKCTIEMINDAYRCIYCGDIYPDYNSGISGGNYMS